MIGIFLDKSLLYTKLIFIGSSISSITLLVPLERVKVLVEVKSTPKLKLIFCIIKLKDKNKITVLSIDIIK